MINHLTQKQTNYFFREMHKALKGIDRFYVFIDIIMASSNPTAVGVRVAIRNARKLLEEMADKISEVKMTKEQIRNLCVEAAKINREATVDIILNSGPTLSPDDIEALEDIACCANPWDDGLIRRD